MGGSMEELLEDKSTPVWVLQLVHQLQKDVGFHIDIVDAINGLEAVTNALQKDFEKMIEVPS
tara:strand:+ start:267 stop:452 length:186 start_codon:yes stop_codon:yes gene_type:complete